MTLNSSFLISCLPRNPTHHQLITEYYIIIFNLSIIIKITRSMFVSNYTEKLSEKYFNLERQTKKAGK